MFVAAVKRFDVHVNEIKVKINTFKISDDLVFGYVFRRNDQIIYA